MKKTIVKASLLAVAMGLSSLAAAADSFSYNYIEGGFGELDGGDFDDGEALFVRGAYDIANNIGLVGGVYLGEIEDTDVTALEIGAQFHQTIQSNLSFHAGVRLFHLEVEAGAGEEDDTGFIVNAGLRFQVQPKLQLEGDVKYLSNDLMDDDGLGLEAGVRYYLNPQLSIAGGLAVDTEFDGLVLGVRYDL